MTGVNTFSLYSFFLYGQQAVIVHLLKKLEAIQTESVDASHKEVQTIYEKEFLNAKIENMILRNKMKTAEEKKDDSNLSTPDTNLSVNKLSLSIC
jgi:hypothetical protein